jgi:membrane protein DedA with SNARE-associated domain
MVASVLTSFTDWLEDISSNWWFLLVILVIAYLDSVIPVVPSETCVILGGIAAGLGAYNLLWVIGAGALGAALGDNTAYLLGQKAGPWIERRYARTDKGTRRLQWAHEQLERRGAMLLITARFIPGGRTVITLSSGITHQPWRRFALADAAAGLIWATYAGTLGFIFGDQFKDDHATAFWLAFATALSVTAIIELIRWIRHRSKAPASAT